ncbi:MAG TPA: potassium-transporting ATPase subunit KdpA [Thermoanaerobaculia bacterium]|jgi:K+-transporting ATPase ATPase A chain|nr:potassium-transporting ATPase subunit KdpA [Thermoanaerobaculia bacterium]
MTANGWLQLALFVLALLAVTKPLGVYMARLFAGERVWTSPLLGPLERAIYRICRVDPKQEQHWTAYTAAMLIFSVVAMLVLYAFERFQGFLPWNPQGFPGVPPALAWNTAASFTTNTNWQAYSGESTMSYLTQMAGLAFHNFVSAGTGIALAIAFIRGISRREAKTIGNFWVDLTRACIHLLLPICVVGALILVSQGVVQNLSPYTEARLVTPQRIETTAAEGKVSTETRTTQILAQGPVASQEIIKQLGTNGGGFMNANSAHPFENPTPLSNFLAMLAIFAIGAGLTYTLGRMAGNQRHGWAVLAAMLALFLVGVFGIWIAEARGNPILDVKGVDQAQIESGAATQAGGNMEGKEVRFGIFNSALFATATTDASCGAVNSMHDSYTPLGGMIVLLNIMLGEIIVGGVGAGLYGMLVMIVLTVFIAGLMVGRTPEYLGKKIEAKDVKMAMLYVLVFALSILGFSAWSSVVPYGTGTLSQQILNNGGPHGLSEIVYAFSSTTGNNGSAFAGITVNTPWYNASLGLAMLIGRFLMIVPMMAIAGNLATKKIVPPSAGTFPVHTPLFVGLLLGVILIVGALTFLPVLSLGPIVEHYLMEAGTLF